jgi:hypothetical protein
VIAHLSARSAPTSSHRLCLGLCLFSGIARDFFCFRECCWIASTASKPQCSLQLTPACADWYSSQRPLIKGLVLKHTGSLVGVRGRVVIPVVVCSAVNMYMGHEWSNFTKGLNVICSLRSGCRDSNRLEFIRTEFHIRLQVTGWLFQSLGTHKKPVTDSWSNSTL